MSSIKFFIEAVVEAYVDFYHLPGYISSKLKILLTENCEDFSCDIFNQILLDLIITFTPPPLLMQKLAENFGPQAWSLEMIIFLRFIIAIYDPPRLQTSINLYNLLVACSL